MSKTIGPYRLNPRGDYNPAADPLYSLLDLVSDGGGSFVYINDTPSNEPTSSTSHWQQIAQKGDTGTSAYQAAVSAGYTGTEQEFNAAMGDLPSAVENAQGLTQVVGGIEGELELAHKPNAPTIGDRFDKIENGTGIQNGTLPPEKMSFIKKIEGKNLHNKATNSAGYQVSNTTGALSAASGMNTTDFIEVVEATDYIRTYSGRVAYYDEYKTFISGIAPGVKTFTTPAGCAYIRASFTDAYLNTFQIELGSTETQYEDYVSPTYITDGIQIGTDNTLSERTAALELNSPSKENSLLPNPHILCTDKITLFSGYNYLPNFDFMYDGYPSYIQSSVNGEAVAKTIALPAVADLSVQKMFEMVLYCDQPSKLRDCRLYLYSGTDFAYMTFDSIIDKSTHGGWMRLKRSKLSGVSYSVSWDSADWSTIDSVKLQTNANEGESVSIAYAAIYAYNQKPVITVNFDGAHEGMYVLAKPILDKYGIKAVIYPQMDEVDTPQKMTWAQLHECEHDGYLIGNHTYSHLNLSTSTEAEIRADLELSLKMLRNHGFRKGIYFLAAPFGTGDRTRFDLYYEYCKYFRFGDGDEGTSLFPSDSALMEHLSASYRSVGSTTMPVAVAKAKIDDVINKQAAWNMTFHVIVNAVPAINLEYLNTDFDEIIAYLAAKRDAGLVCTDTPDQLYYQCNGPVIIDEHGEAKMIGLRNGKMVMVDLEI